MPRPNLLRTIAHVARYLTTWSETMGQRLHRLMAYIQSSLAYRMCAWHDDATMDGPYYLRVLSDSDSAGCAQTHRSTTGAVVVLAR